MFNLILNQGVKNQGVRENQGVKNQGVRVLDFQIKGPEYLKIPAGNQVL